MADEGALVIYGHGADLGNFKFFADDLVTTELTAFDKTKIAIQNVERRTAFFDLLRNPPFTFKIKELHIYSHSIGGGLYLGYHVPMFGMMRAATINRFLGKRTPYNEVINTEEGGVLTDDLVRAPFAGYREKIRANFAAQAKVKIWGCNSGVPNWIYSDPVSETSDETTGDPNAPALYYYWRALNELNVPKPSIAQAFADYFQATTYGAGSGSSIQVKYQGRWMAAGAFLKAKHRRFVTEADVLRLAPDKGDYREYKPR